MSIEPQFTDPAVMVPLAPLVLSGGAPVVLPSEPVLWRVAGGKVEVYLVSASGRDLLAVCAAGQLIFPLLDRDAGQVHLVTENDARLDPVQADLPLTDNDILRWLSDTAARFDVPLPEANIAHASAPQSMGSGDVLSTATPCLVAPQGRLTLDLSGMGALVLSPDAAALSSAVWAQARGAGDTVVCAPTSLSRDKLLETISAHTAVLGALCAARRQDEDVRTLRRLGAGGSIADDKNTSTHAIRVCAEALGVPAEAVSDPPVGAGSSVPALCRLAGMRAREVLLEEGWHFRDHGGALLALEADSGLLRALVWDGVAYHTKGGRRLTAETAETFQHIAYSVSAPLPARIKGIWSLAFYVMRQGNRRDSMISIAAATIAAGLGIMIPLATAWLLSDIVPAGIPGLLVGVGVALAAAALVTTLLSVARALATTRISGRGATVLAAGLTDRLLRLPVGFFKDFSPGDLNQRIENVEAMRQLAVSILMSAGLTAVLSVAYLAVLLSYDAKLALMGVGLVAVYIFAVIAARVLQMEAIREAATLDGEIAGLTYETLDGIGKLRAAAAEERAMERWLAVYRRERAAEVRAGVVSTSFSAFSDSYQTLTLMLLFAGAGALAASDAPAGVFIGFLSAFGSFQGAFVGLSEALLEIYSAQPLVERAKPILEAEPETSSGREDPGKLRGEIEGAGLTFAYGTGVAPVLNKLDFHVRPGEHMAIVGGSGSGKSTLLRLLLGFETPQTGSILYDGQELSHLDLTRVRGQIGVVLQASELFAGSILENIRGASDASLETCLDAAGRAGLSRDLEYFAMGLHTPITEGANTLSGGQRQRILIARALAATPNILFFDEATSALDNATQAVVSQTLDALKVTRITIAHRLSTVRHADRICVLKEGKFVEQGTFDELMGLGGAFAELARRQLTEE